MRNPFTCSDPQIIRLLTILIDKVNCMSETLASTEAKLTADYAALAGVVHNAVALIGGIPAQIQAAVAAALAAGATPDQLKPLDDLDASINASFAELTAAIPAQAAPADPAAPTP